MKLIAPLFTLMILSQPGLAKSAEVTPIRAMTGNISSGSHQSYDNGEGLRIFQGLKPDVVMIQEFNYKSNSQKDLAEMILTAFSDKFSFYRESESTDQIPNGIISRFPILESGEWQDKGMPNRDFAWARMDIPGDRDLWAISVHLHSSKVLVRKQESEDLRDLIKALPAKDYVLLGGDFNIQGREDPVIRTLAEAVFEKAAPTDSQGRTTTNMTNKKNYDWLLNDQDLAEYQVPVKFKASAEEAEVELENVYPNGLVFDSSTFPRLDRVAPILPTDSRAAGMQHLAVVKDYAVPAPEAVVISTRAKVKPASSRRSIQKSKNSLAKNPS
jgi:endonuclease/exonuclease/phosphatase family metal-dependent hydrolase